MRAALIALAVLGLPAVGHAETMLLKNPEGIMCRDEKSLAEFSGTEGAVKPGVTANFSSPLYKRYSIACQSGGFEVQVVTKRVNTSIVTYRGQTWYVPNIAYMTPTPDCLRDGAQVTFAGKIGTNIHHNGEDDVKGSLYPRLVLDKPVCYLGNYADPAARYMSLVPIEHPADYTRLMGMVGRHVTATGKIEDPTTVHHPQDLMMMMDPVVKPAP